MLMNRAHTSIRLTKPNFRVAWRVALSQLNSLLKLLRPLIDCLRLATAFEAVL